MGTKHVESDSMALRVDFLIFTFFPLSLQYFNLPVCWKYKPSLFFIWVSKSGNTDTILAKSKAPQYIVLSLMWKSLEGMFSEFPY